jgi:predicted nucleic acid-binding protein
VILLDASVLIEYLRRRDARLEKAMNELDLGVCGVTRAEVLHGAQGEEDEKTLLRLLDEFTPVILSEEIWDKLGHRLRQLRSRGVIVPFSDAVLATVALERDVHLWTYDRHFRLIADILPLKLYDPQWL